MDIRVNVTLDLAESVYELFNSFSNPVGSAKLVKPKKKKEEMQMDDIQLSDKNAMKNDIAINTGVQEMTAKPSISLEAVRERVSEHVKSGKRDEIIKILSEYGVTGFSQLKGEELESFYERVKEL